MISLGNNLYIKLHNFVLKLEKINEKKTYCLSCFSRLLCQIVDKLRQLGTNEKLINRNMPLHWGGPKCPAGSDSFCDCYFFSRKHVFLVFDFYFYRARQFFN